MLSLSLFIDEVQGLPPDVARDLRRPGIVFRIPDYPTVVIRPGGPLHQALPSDVYTLDFALGKSCLLAWDTSPPPTVQLLLLLVDLVAEPVAARPTGGATLDGLTSEGGKGLFLGRAKHNVRLAATATEGFSEFKVPLRDLVGNVVGTLCARARLLYLDKVLVPHMLQNLTRPLAHEWWKHDSCESASAQASETISRHGPVRGIHASAAAIASASGGAAELDTSRIPALTQQSGVLPLQQDSALALSGVPPHQQDSAPATAGCQSSTRHLPADNEPRINSFLSPAAATPAAPNATRTEEGGPSGGGGLSAAPTPAAGAARMAAEDATTHPHLVGASAMAGTAAVGTVTAAAGGIPLAAAGGTAAAGSIPPASGSIPPAAAAAAPPPPPAVGAITTVEDDVDCRACAAATGAAEDGALALALPGAAAARAHRPAAERQPRVAPVLLRGATPAAPARVAPPPPPAAHVREQLPPSLYFHHASDAEAIPVRPAVGWAPRQAAGGAAAAGGGAAAGACGRVAEAAAPHAAAERATEAAAALIKQLEAMLPRTAGPAEAAQAALPSPAPEAAFAAPAAFSVAAACHPSSGPGEHASLLQSLADEIGYVRSTAYATEVIRSAVLHRRQDPATQRHRLVAAHDRARQVARAAARHRAADAGLSDASLAPSGHEGRCLSPTQRASEERFARARRAVASQRAWCSSSLRTSRRAGEGTVTLSNDCELREADGEGRPSEAACAMSSSQEAPIISPEALVCLRIAEESQADPNRDECCRRYDGGVPAWAATTQPSARSAARDTKDAACGEDVAADRTAPRPPVAPVQTPCAPSSPAFADGRPPLAPQPVAAASRPLDALPPEDIASEALLDVLQRTFKRVDLSGLGVAPLAHVLRGLRSALASEAAQLRTSVWVPPLQALCNKLEARLEAAQLSQRAALEFLAIEWEDLTRLASSATDHKLHEYVRGHEAPAATGGAERRAAASHVDSVLANVGGVARSFELQGRGGRGMSRADEGKLLASSASAVRSAAADLDGAILSSVASSIVVEGTAADPALQKEEHEARYFVSCTGDEVQEVVAASPSGRRGPTEDDLPAARRQAHVGHGPATSESPALPLIEPSSTALVAPHDVAGGSGLEHSSRAASCTQARVVQPTSAPSAAPIKVLGRAVVAPTTTCALAAGLATPQQGGTSKVVPALSVVVTKPAPKPA